MKKILKSFLVLGGIAAVSYQGFRLYRMFKVAQKLEKDLPGYLDEQYGEIPTVGCTIAANVLITTTIIIKFSKETVAKNENMDAKVRQYIVENYPLLATGKLSVLVVENTLSKAEIIQKYNPKLYKMFGKIIEKKLKEKETTHVYEEPTD